MQNKPLAGKPARFGCMNASALGAMIANPADLVEGGQPGAGDADYLIRGLELYREGKAKEPKTQATN